MKLTDIKAELIHFNLSYANRIFICTGNKDYARALRHKFEDMGLIVELISSLEIENYSNLLYDCNLIIFLFYNTRRIDYDHLAAFLHKNDLGNVRKIAFHCAQKRNNCRQYHKELFEVNYLITPENMEDEILRLLHHCIFDYT